MEFFLGQHALQQEDAALAEFHYQRAHDAWPAWPAPALALAEVARIVEDYEASLPFYDAALALVPDQRDALLGKARSLSYLDRSPEALPLLDRLIEMGRWHLAEAHFWRAWNRFNLAEIEAARADAALAIGYRPDAESFALSDRSRSSSAGSTTRAADLETALEIREPLLRRRVPPRPRPHRGSPLVRHRVRLRPSHRLLRGDRPPSRACPARAPAGPRHRRGPPRPARAAAHRRDRRLEAAGRPVRLQRRSGVLQPRHPPRRAPLCRASPRARDVRRTRNPPARTPGDSPLTDAPSPAAKSLRRRTATVSPRRRRLSGGWLGGERRPQRDLAVAFGVPLARTPTAMLSGPGVCVPGTLPGPIRPHTRGAAHPVRADADSGSPGCRPLPGRRGVHHGRRYCTVIR